MEPKEIPPALLRLVARAQFRSAARYDVNDADIPEPNILWLGEAARLLRAFDAEGLDWPRDKSLDPDMRASEEGS